MIVYDPDNPQEFWDAHIEQTAKTKVAQEKFAGEYASAWLEAEAAEFARLRKASKRRKKVQPD